jgi:ring-1,2-phenylacetyl-CoA epoxidase subunit PaaD
MIRTEKEIWTLLEEVKDPEIPVLSLVDLGVITEVALEGGKVRIEMTPTFAGCPAIEAMKSDVLEKLHAHGIKEAEVNVSFRQPWNSNKITDKGRKALKEFGLAPPPKHDLIIDLEILEHVPCPYCDSENTELKTPFGPTLCRSMHYCHQCKQAFEQFKPL